MLKRIAKRIGLAAAVVWSVVTITFVALHAGPGDPAALLAGPAATPGQIAALTQSLGLDRPLPVQYGTWLGNFVTGDWGQSLSQTRPVLRIIREAVGPTVLLVGLSLGLSYIAGVAIGVFQATRHRSRWDTGLSTATPIVYGLPSYWVALVLILIFTYYASVGGWAAWLQFPAFGMTGIDADFLPWSGRLVDRLRHLFLPTLTLSLIGAAAIARFARGAMLEVHRQSFVTAATARGLPGSRVQFGHAMRSGLLPLVTLLGLNLPALFSGAVFVEVIFGWPGMGRVMVQGVLARDYPIVLATTSIFAILVVLGNAIADALYLAVDPRLRRSGT